MTSERSIRLSGVEIPSRTQTDKLGERLKRGTISDADLELLDRFRRTFGPAYEAVVSVIRDTLGLEPTGRPAKTIPSVREKLRRESIRLTQMQDIAGCRLVATNIVAQDAIVGRLHDVFSDATIVDRRAEPSYGYRAVHVIVRKEGLPVEVQVRTALQHLWAEVSEKCGDVDPGIKYGAGRPEWSSTLLRISDVMYQHELLRVRHGVIQARASVEESFKGSDIKNEIVELGEELERSHHNYIETLQQFADFVEKAKSE